MNIQETLSSWLILNRDLPQTSEQDCQRLMEAEMSGQRRRRVLLRIHSRLNKLRAQRERLELMKI